MNEHRRPSAETSAQPIRGRKSAGDAAAGQRSPETIEAARRQRAVEAIGRVAGTIAHDFNNALQGIVGSLEVIERKIADGNVAGAQRWVKSALAASEKAAALSNRLLAVSRRPQRSSVVDVNTLITGLDAAAAVGPSIMLQLDHAADLWATRCDPAQFAGAFMALIDNAREAMAAGGVLTVATSNVSLGAPARVHNDVLAPFVRVAVSDTGIGMTRDVADRAFEPFFTTKTDEQAAGLGLAAVNSFVRAVQGHARIDSTPGKGTTVAMFLPKLVEET